MTTDVYIQCMYDDQRERLLTEMIQPSTSGFGSELFVIKYNKKRTGEIDEWGERNGGYFILDLLVTIVKGS